MLNPIEIVRKATGMQAAPAAPAVVEPVCQAADALCELNEKAKALGYDIPALVKDKTGVDVPTHLPQVAQDHLSWVNSVTNGYVTPMNAFLAYSGIASLVGIYATYKTLSALRNAISRDCPTDIYETIKDDEKMMAFYQLIRQNNPELLVALSQMDQASAKQFFGKADQAKLMQMEPAEQQKLVKAVMEKNGQKFNQKTHDARVKAAAKKVEAEKAKAEAAAKASVVVPGTQQASAGMLTRAWNMVPAMPSFRGAAPAAKATVEEQKKETIALK